MKLSTTFMALSILVMLPSIHVTGQTVLSGDLTVDTDLGPNGDPADTEYIINGTLRVYGTDGSDGITTLSIEPGVTFKFNPGSSSALQIGSGSSPGSIKAEGSEEDSIYFTSANAEPANGDWRFINLTPTAKNCLFDYAVIEYGGKSQGYSTDAAILTAADTLILSNSVVRTSGSNGITILQNTARVALNNVTLENNNHSGMATYQGSGYTVVLDNSRILSNSYYGLDIKHNVDLQINNSTLDANGSGCMILNPDVVGGINTSNIFTEAGLIEVISGNITRNAFWPGFYNDYGVWYYINNSLNIFGSTEFPAILEIGEGAEFRFRKSSGSLIQVGNGGNKGNLFVLGTETNPVNFTSADASPNPGDWRCLNFTADAVKCILENVEIEYGGSAQGYGDDASIKSEADSLFLSNVTISQSATHGIAVNKNTNLISANNLTLENNGKNGLYANSGSAYSIIINNSSFLSNSHYGINIGLDIDFQLNQSIFGSNMMGEMRLHPNIVGGIENTNIFNAPGNIEVITGNITKSAFWPGFYNDYGVWYYINNSLNIFGSTEFPAILEIGEGAEFRFRKSSGSLIQVGNGGNKGNLFVLGTETNPVNFTSADASPNPGDWRCLNFTADAVKCVLENVEIEYGGSAQGYGDDASIKTEADSLFMTNVIVRQSETHGISVRQNTNLISANYLLLENNGKNGLYTYGGYNYSININNSSFLSNGYYGINIGQDIDFLLDHSIFGSNSIGQMRLHPNIVGGVDSTNSFNTPGNIEVISGNITSNAFWPGFFSEFETWYYINSALNIYGTPDTSTALVIGEGAEVRFLKSSGSVIQVGNGGDKGSLFVRGTESNPVKFTSAEALPNPGDWRYINLTADANKCVFENVEIEYGGHSQGYADDATIRTEADSLLLTNVFIRNSATHGITIRQNSNYISADNLALEDNAKNGLMTYGGTDYELLIINSSFKWNGDRGLMVKNDLKNFSIKQSVFGSNANGAMSLHPNIAGGIDQSNSFDSITNIEVISGNITNNAFWPGFFSDYGTWYYINNALYVYGTSEIPTTLTIGEGAELRFLKSSGSILQVGNGGNKGNILVNGTESKPVKFTTATESPAPGDWRYINLTADANKCVFENVEIEYGGHSQGYADDATIRTEADSLFLTKVTVKKSATQGITIRQNSNYISADTLSLEDNARNGLLTYGGNEYSIHIKNSLLKNNGDRGLNIRNNLADFTIKKTIFESNTNGSMSLHPNMVGGVDSTNSFNTPGNIDVIQGNIDKDSFWPGFYEKFGVWYLLNNSLKVFGSDEVPAILEIGEGAELRIASSSQVTLQVGDGNKLGTLIARGSKEQPVTFTSSLSEPTPGNWRMIILTSKAINCVLDRVNFLYGGKNQGYDTDSELLVESSSASITRCTFSFSEKNGMCLQSIADPYTFDNTFLANGGNGVYIKSMQNDMDFSFNNFPGNIGSGCYNNNGTFWADASYSYWGSEDGPSGIGPGTGDEATGQVIIDPWLTSPVTPMMELSANTDSLSYEESAASIYVITGLRWDVSSDNDWISFDTTQGTKIDSFIVSFTENPSADPRTTTINITSGDTLTRLIDITQPGAPPEFSHNAPDSLPSEAGVVDIDLATNYTWSIAYDCDWITVDPTDGYFDGAISVSYTDNTMFDSRICTITVNGGGITEEILLKQMPLIDAIASRTKDDTFKIYPNPASDGKLYIVRSNPAGTDHLIFTLINSLGQGLISGNLPDERNCIDVTDFPDGMFLLRISGSQGSLSDHVIVIRK